jgi:hypothetical protein
MLREVRLLRNYSAKRDFPEFFPARHASHLDPMNMFRALVAHRTFCGAKWPALARPFADFVHQWVTITALSAQFVFERRQQLQDLP